MLLLAGLFLAGCGGSASTTRSVSTSRSSSVPPGAPSSRTTTTSGGGGEGGSGSGSVGVAGAAGARLPATFRVGGGGRLDPPVISSPASLAIQLTVVSGDGKSHRALLRTPTPHALSVPAGGRATVLIGGLAPGHYVLTIDGVARGALDVGAHPGP